MDLSPHSSRISGSPMDSATSFFRISLSLSMAPAPGQDSSRILGLALILIPSKPPGSCLSVLVSCSGGVWTRKSKEMIVQEDVISYEVMYAVILSFFTIKTFTPLHEQSVLSSALNSQVFSDLFSPSNPLARISFVGPPGLGYLFPVPVPPHMVAERHIDLRNLSPDPQKSSLQADQSQLLKGTTSSVQERSLS